MERRVRERLNQYVFGADDDTLESIVAQMLADRRLTLASIESGTGGLFAGRLAGMGNAFRGGLTVSELEAGDLDAALEAAREARDRQASDLGLAAIVRAAPEGTGLQLFVAYVSADDQLTIERSFGGHTALAAQWASTAALGLLWRQLHES
jgi:nicotinamide mononucleotide (NMN) deamidase PncC